MDTLTCKCVRILTPSGQPALMCQVTSTPSDLKPGSIYSFTCRSEDETLSGRQFRFQWTGSEWQRKKSSVTDDHHHHQKKFLVSSHVAEAEKENERNFLKENYYLTDLKSSWLSRPFSIQVKERESSSILSSYNRPLLTVQLDLSRRGFLLGEQLPFELTFMNPKPTNIQKVSMALVQKLTCLIPGKKRETTLTTMARQEKMGFDIYRVNKASKLCWTSQFLISKEFRPSVTCEERNGDETVEVCYYLEFTVEMTEGHAGPCGKAPVVFRQGGQRKGHRLSRILNI